MDDRKELASMSIPPAEASAEWARDMNQHYARTGEYRAQDLTRVLGDPRDCVEISASNSSGSSCIAKAAQGFFQRYQ
jgi:hypothetical protein